jgi:hypothetical protein
LPEGFNQLKHPHDTEQMIQFHLAAGSWQLQQAYWGIMAAVALKRVYVLPGFHCFCARNWWVGSLEGHLHLLQPVDRSLISCT